MGCFMITIGECIKKLKTIKEEMDFPMKLVPKDKLHIEQRKNMVMYYRKSEKNIEAIDYAISVLIKLKEGIWTQEKR